MKKYKIVRRLILGVFMISVILTACSQNTVETNQAKTESTTVTTTVMAESTTEKEATTSESTTNKSDDSDTSTKPAEQKSAGQTTTKKVTTTQKQTTTERQTTTKKVNTTQKPTTTKKVTTTEAPYFCDEGGTHHSCDAGPIDWVDSFDEAKDKALEYAGENGDSGNFRVKKCLYCGKYTATVTFK